MGKLKKKGQSGAAANYITRNQALKKLQVTLADFRFSIFFSWFLFGGQLVTDNFGIYPREPKNKKKANKGSTTPATFYYFKDVHYLLHEPVLEKFREHKIFVRKLSKALGKQQYGIAKSLESNKPVYTLDHIIKERYPSFTDALRDLDDALCMLFLFSTFPATDKIKNETVLNCQRLSSEFQHYIMHTRSLRKVFLSIKGIYYQAEIKGQTITWIVPYQFSQQVPDDIDFRIMLTFLEFYQTLVGFVNFKLFTEANLVYPPKFDKLKDEAAAGLGAYIIEFIDLVNIHQPLNNDLNKRKETRKELVQKKESEERLKTLSRKLQSIKDHDLNAIKTDCEESEVNSVPEIRQEEIMIDEFTEQTNGKSSEQSHNDPATKMITYRDLYSASVAVQELQQLFSKCVFYLSREVPRYSLEFIIRTFGGQVGWDPTVGFGSPYVENDERITHQICDRPSQEHRFLSRSYIQPQWVYDCINAHKLLTMEPYQPGKIPPPHLSPFVEHKEGDYIPDIDKYFEDHDSISIGPVQEEITVKDDSQTSEDMEDEEEDINDSEHDEDLEKPLEDKFAKKKMTNSRIEENQQSEEENEEKLRILELEAEAKGISFSKYQKKETNQQSVKNNSIKKVISTKLAVGKKRTIEDIQEEEEKDAKELAKIMMSKKQRKLYDKIQYGKKKQEKKVANLQKKKELISAIKSNDLKSVTHSADKKTKGKNKNSGVKQL
ncbi:hypothetical protein G9A89_023025 [Geosiphon pyriformis]|nr:hypothetical protein G9A89_023025 [Geosiphon pyriformis]